MTDDIKLIIGEDGKASLYDDTYDVIIHCESQEEQDEVRRVLENVSKWIPVADELPNILEDVLISYYDEVMVGWLIDDETWFAEGFGRLNMNDIAAWQLLPEPYKGATT